MFAKGDVVAHNILQMTGGVRAVGAVTNVHSSETASWLSLGEVAVRWRDGSQGVVSAVYLTYADHPDLTKREEVEAWLAK